MSADEDEINHHGLTDEHLDALLDAADQELLAHIHTSLDPNATLTTIMDSAPACTADGRSPVPASAERTPQPQAAITITMRTSVRTITSDITRAIDITRGPVPALIRDRDSVYDLARSLARDRDLARDLACTIDRARDLDRARAVALNQALELEHELAYVIDLALVFGNALVHGPARPRARELAVASSRPSTVPSTSTVPSAPSPSMRPESISLTWTSTALMSCMARSGPIRPPGRRPSKTWSGPAPT